MEFQCRVLAAMLVLVCASHAPADGPPKPGSDGPPGGADAPFDFEMASKNIPKPREIWPIVKQHLVPLEFKIRSDEIITC